jgi:anti-sigma factor RsiW
MPCREFVDVLTDYLEDALSPSDRLRLEVHLAICAKCALYLEQMRETLAAVGRIDIDALPPGARDDLMHAFREWSAGRA